MMTPNEAIVLLKKHSYVHDDLTHPKMEKGFLGMLRPFGGEIYEESFHEVMGALKVLGNQFRQDHPPRELISCVWSICHFTKDWALDPEGMLRSNNLISQHQIELLSKWVDAISSAIVNLLEGLPDDEVFEVYQHYTKQTRAEVAKSGYAEVNGLKMYYEIYGDGKPVILIHGGGSTIQTSFGRLIPLLAKGRKVIGVEMQAHGRTGDRDAGLSFAQDADDIVALMDHLQISEADIMGFSNGGQTGIEIGIRYPEKINKLIIASAFYKRNAMPEAFWESMNSAAFEDMPQPFKDAFLEVNNDKEALLNMFNRDVQRMQTFKGWTEDQLKSIPVKTLVISGDSDVGGAEHAVEMSRLIPGAQLAIIPGGHGKLIGEITTLEHGRWKQEYVAVLIGSFLNE